MKRKQNISKQAYNPEQFSPLLEKLRKDTQGFNVPDGYFDSLSPRIIDSIKKQENRSFYKAIIPHYRKQLVWRSIMAVMVFAAMIISFVLVRKNSTVVPAYDEWAEINMAYDASYAEEARLAESYSLDKEIESSVVKNIGYETLIQNEPTVNEITEYFKEHDTDTDILNEY